ncbi:SIR2 family protein [Paraburkholderia kirstenboschensis]|uniref:SIR2 family protein n=1 Tax=Paraburkholderia kirstenboschensis TaxID=1245436 RepID=A0ABZ0EQX2_9BURK|nr:SIR2 family protein [Paraburkholderia kirstenboschensis]WOD19115.1 SIR2 family protein [Paraburkholderia kirstenboschensis]
MSKAEAKSHLTERYIGCRPGETVKRIANFVWKSAFTFNIDDALEAAYQSHQRPRQKIESLNYGTAYQSPANRSQLPIIHLHGFVREEDKGYVFSVAEYGRVTRGLNPWMHVLSKLLASDPFIISETGLNESDLEYYLGGRTEVSPRKNRGPSILVEPFPDAVTESDCHRHGLLLVKATLSEFLGWLGEKLGSPPTVQELLIPSTTSIFSTPPTQLEQVAFFTDFYLVRPVAPVPDSNPTPFFDGRLHLGMISNPPWIFPPWTSQA